MGMYSVTPAKRQLTPIVLPQLAPIHASTPRTYISRYDILQQIFTSFTSKILTSAASRQGPAAKNLAIRKYSSVRKNAAQERTARLASLRMVRALIAPILYLVLLQSRSSSRCPPFRLINRLLFTHRQRETFAFQGHSAAVTISDFIFSLAMSRPRDAHARSPPQRKVVPPPSRLSTQRTVLYRDVTCIPKPCIILF